MNEYQSSLEEAIKEIDKLRAVLKKSKSVQVRSIDEKTIIKATAHTWFNNHRALLKNILGEEALKLADGLYRETLALSDKDGSRSKFDGYCKNIKQTLSSIRVENVTKFSSAKEVHSDDLPPKFSSFISDPEMVSILERRWAECIVCVKNNAPLSAIVMMGGLLETLLLTKFLQASDKNKIFAAKNCPKDKATNKALNFKDWALRNFIEVAHELGWISQTEKDLGEVLRDYRNYIHPYKEKSHGIKLEGKDASILWEVAKSISRQIVNTPTP